MYKVCLSCEQAFLCVQYLIFFGHMVLFQIFFVDSLKFFLSLYGHKLPALGMDISSDGALLVTGSADKNIKIWGMDFGDCHKSLFAHADRYKFISFSLNTGIVM